MLTRTLTSVVALVWAGSAYAQTAPTSSPLTSQDASVLDEIIVTAQRRSERLVDVPITIATVSSEDIERAGSEAIENITRTVPGVYIQRAVYGVSPTVRGIGSTLSTTGGEQNVSIYLDGVYQSSAVGNTFDLANVSSIEILKGPQGTLFGRNATGGAILVNTLDPSFTPGGRLNLAYERFNTVRASGYVTAPLSDVLAVNAAVSYRHSDGYIEDLRTGQLVNESETFIARAKLLFQPTDNFSAILSASHSRFDDPTGSNYQAFFLSPAYQFAGNDAGPIATDRYHLSHNTRDEIESETDAFSAHLKFELDAGTLTAISSYQDTSLFSVNDLDATYATIPAPIVLPPPLPPLVVGVIPTHQYLSLSTRAKTFTQEINFTSRDDGPFKYVAGAFYYSTESRLPGMFVGGAPTLHSAGEMKAYAVYVDGSYDFGSLSLIGGLRYTSEEREGRSGNGAVDPAPFTRVQIDDDSQLTPRVGLRYAFSPQSNAYATYTRGFKSGVFDLTSPTGNAINAETINAYEIGYKTANPTFTFNAAAFYYDYQDTQVNATVSGSTGVFNQLFNVPESEIYGLDLDGTYRFNEAFDIRAALAYTHARYVDFPFAPGYVVSPTATTGFGLVLLSTSIDASGNTMVRSPEFTASTTFNYHHTFANDTRLDVSVSPYYSSKVYFTFDNSLSQDAYVTVDANATLTFNENLTLSVFGRNLTDESYAVAKNINNLVGVTNFATPRTYGVALGYAF